MIFVVLLYAISATTFVFSKALLTCITPLVLTGIRTCGAGLGLLSYLYIIRGSLNIKKNIFFTCLQIAFFSFFVSNTIKFIALNHLSSLKASIIAMSEPLFALVIAYFLCNEMISIRKLLGLLICVCGALSVHSSSYGNFLMSDLSITWHEGLLLISIVAGAYGALLMRIAINNRGMSIVQVNGLSMFLAGIGALLTSYIMQEQSIAVAGSEYSLLSLGCMLISLIIISNVIGYTLYGVLLKKYSVMFISAASFVRPFFTALYKWILFNEMIGFSLICSTVIICFGLYILYKEETVTETSMAVVRSSAQ